MKLDQSIEQRLKELEEINKEIRGNRDVQEQEDQMNRQNYYQLLAAKMEKAKQQYQTIAKQTLAKGYNDVSVGRFRPDYQDQNQAQQALDDANRKNRLISEVLERIQQQNPDLDGMIANLQNW